MSENLSEKIKWNADGLVPVVTQDATTRQVLMHAWMNKESLEKTLATKQMVYFSRSRNTLWRKGETSGHMQELVKLWLDCDSDTLLAEINQTGAACHTGEMSCFFTPIA